MSDTAPNRRSFRFSLRTLFVVVTLFGCWLGWQVHLVGERRSFLAKTAPTVSPGTDTYALRIGDGDEQWKESRRRRTPWVWRLLGGQSVLKIALDPKEYTEHDVAQFEVLFPEADIERIERWDRRKIPQHGR